MAGAQAVRLAFEACRPTRSSLHLRPLLHTRTFTHSRHRADATDATSSSTTPNGTEQQSAAVDTSTENEILETMPTTPPKRAPPSIARPAPSSASEPVQHTHTISSRSTSSTSDPSPSEPTTTTRKPIPPNILAAYQLPFKHRAPYGVPCASLQLRSYSVRNLEFFADFCLRAAFYLSLPASGPVPLPRRRERWTVIRSNFVHKKSQENFERITHKRLITIMDGETSVVETWLAFVRRWQFYGVGMKANVWEWEGVDVAGKMDAEAKDLEKGLSEKMGLFGFNKEIAERASLGRLLERQRTGHRGPGAAMSEVRQGSLTPESWADRYGVDWEEEKKRLQKEE